MATTSAIATKRANLPGEQTDEVLRKRRNFLRSKHQLLIDRVRAINPVKPAFFLKGLTGAHERTCDYWLQKKRLPPEAIFALLQHDQGILFLLDIMRNTMPRWFTWLIRMGVTVSAMRRRAADRRLIQEAMDADQELSSEIARAEATLAHTDEDFRRPYLDALRDMGRQGGAQAGARHRAVAQADGDH